MEKRALPLTAKGVPGCRRHVSQGEAGLGKAKTFVRFPIKLEDTFSFIFHQKLYWIPYSLTRWNFWPIQQTKGPEASVPACVMLPLWASVSSPVRTPTNPLRLLEYRRVGGPRAHRRETLRKIFLLFPGWARECRIWIARGPRGLQPDSNAHPLTQQTFMEHLLLCARHATEGQGYSGEPNRPKSLALWNPHFPSGETDKPQDK